MTRRWVSPIAKAFLVGVICALLLPAPAQGAPVTVDFSGTVDLSSEGGPAVNTFNGSITWDPDAVPFEGGAGIAVYDPLAYTLIFNGDDQTAPVIGSGTGSGIGVVIDTAFLAAYLQDALFFFLTIDQPFPLSQGETDVNILAAVAGPITMFDSTALPADLSFLGDVETSLALFFTGPDEQERFLDVASTLVVTVPTPTAVPEPATLLLTALGGAAALIRRSGKA